LVYNSYNYYRNYYYNNYFKLEDNNKNNYKSPTLKVDNKIILPQGDEKSCSVFQLSYINTLCKNDNELLKQSLLLTSFNNNIFITHPEVLKYSQSNTYNDGLKKYVEGLQFTSNVKQPLSSQNLTEQEFTTWKENWLAEYKKVEQYRNNFTFDNKQQKWENKYTQEQLEAIKTLMADKKHGGPKQKILAKKIGFENKNNKNLSQEIKIDQLKTNIANAVCKLWWQVGVKANNYEIEVIDETRANSKNDKADELNKSSNNNVEQIQNSKKNAVHNLEENNEQNSQQNVERNINQNNEQQNQSNIKVRLKYTGCGGLGGTKSLIDSFNKTQNKDRQIAYTKTKSQEIELNLSDLQTVFAK
jgi:hypothetical protein